MSETKEETTKATEGREESKKLSQDELVELSPKDYAAYRKLRRDEAGAKISEILAEYDVAIDAEMRISSGSIVPKILLVDALPQGNNS